MPKNRCIQPFLIAASLEQVLCFLLTSFLLYFFLVRSFCLLWVRLNTKAKCVPGAWRQVDGGITPLKQKVFLEKCFEQAAEKRMFLAEISAQSQDFVITGWGVGCPVSSSSIAAWVVYHQKSLWAFLPWLPAVFLIPALGKLIAIFGSNFLNFKHLHKGH